MFVRARKGATMGEVLYDIGYGNDAPDVFLKRLKGAGVSVVLDVENGVIPNNQTGGASAPPHSRGERWDSGLNYQRIRNEV